MTMTQKRTQDKMNFIKERQDRGMSKDQIRQECMIYFSCGRDAFHDAFNLLNFGTNRIRNLNRTVLINSNVEKVSRIDRLVGECYFCGSKTYLIQHHISYVPEILVTLDKSCHGKIHAIMDVQQNQIKKNNESMAAINHRLDLINKLLNAPDSGEKEEPQ